MATKTIKFTPTTSGDDIKISNDNINLDASAYCAVERLSVTKSYNSSTPTNWSVSKTKSGYKSVAFSMAHSYSAGLRLAAEAINFGDGTFSASGYGMFAYENAGTNCTVNVYVVWVKN